MSNFFAELPFVIFDGNLSAFPNLFTKHYIILSWVSDMDLPIKMSCSQGAQFFVNLQTGQITTPYHWNDCTAPYWSFFVASQHLLPFHLWLVCRNYFAGELHAAVALPFYFVVEILTHLLIRTTVLSSTVVSHSKNCDAAIIAALRVLPGYSLWWSWWRGWRCTICCCGCCLLLGVFYSLSEQFAMLNKFLPC